MPEVLGESKSKNKPLMVLRGYVHDLRFSWWGKTDIHKKVIGQWRGNTPLDTKGDLLSYHNDDFITNWDDEVARKVTAFRDMANFIEGLKDALQRDWQEFKRELPVIDLAELKISQDKAD